jgi:hypothetical protein
MKGKIMNKIISFLSLMAFSVWSQTAMLNMMMKVTPESGVYGAWFGWQDVQAQKPKLVIEYSMPDNNTKTVTFQHGLNGQIQPQSFYLHSSGTWEDKVGGTREGHKHNIHLKRSPLRTGFFKCDFSSVPSEAAVKKATLWLHIHSVEGLKLDGGDGVIGFYECNRDWDWDEITWTEYRTGRRWTTAGGDAGNLIVKKDRQADIAHLGYHKTGDRNWPLDLTGYVSQLQDSRATTRVTYQGRKSRGSINAVPNPFRTNLGVNVITQNAKCKNQNLSRARTRDAKLDIFNMQGKLMHSKAGLKSHFNTSLWPAGSYIVKAMVNNESVTKNVTLIK